MTTTKIKAPVYPTEDAEKVRAAIKSIFPDADLTLSADARSLEGTATLGTFKELLRNQRIRDAARSVLLRHQTGNAVTFKLNKQVAAIGKVNFSVDESKEAPLGDITVMMEAESESALAALIGDLAPTPLVSKALRDDSDCASAKRDAPRKKKARNVAASEAHAYFKAYDEYDKGDGIDVF